MKIPPVVWEELESAQTDGQIIVNYSKIYALLMCTIVPNVMSVVVMEGFL